MEKIQKVLTNCPQGLTPAEQKQGRNNLGLADVASSGSYSDLTDTPAIPTVNDAVFTLQVNGNQLATFTANAATDVTANVNVPTKTSDLQNDSGFITSSAIPAVNNGTLTIQKNGTTVQTFTANSSSSKTANIAVPTKTSDLQNDSGFITSSAIPSVGNGTITLQKNGSTVDSFTTNQSSNKTINIAVPTKTSDITNDSGFITSADLPTVNDATLTLQVNGVDLQTFSANSATNKTANIVIPPECNVFVATYNVSTWAEVKAAYDAGKVIVLEGANFGSNVHTQMLMYNYSTSSGQTEKFLFAPTNNLRVATASKYWATLDETAGWASDYYSNAYPNISYGVFQLSGDETARSLVEHRGYLSNNVFNFDIKYFSSANACNIYVGYVDQPLEFDVIGTRRLIRNDLKRAASSSTTVYDLVNNIDKTDRIVINAQTLNGANPRIDIATLGPQEQSLSSADIYWDLDLLVRQSGVLGGLSSGFHLHIEKYGNESTNSNYIFGTIAGTDLR